MAVRKIKLLCLNHANVVSFDDTGDIKGEMSSNRQALRRNLEKRTDVNGRPVRTFMLAEAPPSFVDGDAFDETYLRDDAGAWRVASPEWLEERKRRCDEAQARADEMSNRTADIARKEVADGIVELLQREVRKKK